MTIPLWVLLGFAGWTLVVLSATVGVYRWFSILTGQTTIGEWQRIPDSSRTSRHFRFVPKSAAGALYNRQSL
jgi:hypothetical protein